MAQLVAETNLNGGQGDIDTFGTNQLSTGTAAGESPGCALRIWGSDAAVGTANRCLRRTRFVKEICGVCHTFHDGHVSTISHDCHKRHPCHS